MSYDQDYRDYRLSFWWLQDSFLRFYARPSITGDVESIIFQFICFLLPDESLWTAAAIIINCPVEEEGIWGLITCEAKWTTVIQAETTTTTHDGVLNRSGYLIFLLVGCIGTREQWKAINLIRISQNTGNKSWTCLWAKEKECCRWKLVGQAFRRTWRKRVLGSIKAFIDRICKTEIMEENHRWGTY